MKVLEAYLLSAIMYPRGVKNSLMLAYIMLLPN